MNLTADATVVLSRGVVTLAQKDAELRISTGLLVDTGKRVKKGTVQCEIQKPIQLKRGTVFGYDGSTKHLRLVSQPEPEPVPAEPGEGAGEKDLAE